MGVPKGYVSWVKTAKDVFKLLIQNIQKFIEKMAHGCIVFFAGLLRGNSNVVSVSFLLPSLPK